MAQEEYRVITNKGTDVAEIDQLLQRDTSSDAGVDSNIIPDRTCDVSHAKATNNRITCYMLEPEEAIKLKADGRIKDVEPSSTDQAREMFAVQNAQFQRTTTNGQNDKNWGLYRHILKDWEQSQASNTFTGDYNYTLDGTGVDIVIQDDGVDPTGHPEWNDYNGTTRFQQIDWYAASGVTGSMPANYYTNGYSDSNPAGAHGSHCCGIAAGATYGWAKNAQLFSVRLFGGSAAMNGNDIYDVIREWHLKKPIDPNTGFRRPTIVNQSWGYSWYYSNNAGAQLQSIFFKGVDQSITPATFSSSFINYGMTNTKHPTQNSFADTEQELLTDAGIICVKAAGNSYHPFAYGTTGEYGSDIYNSYYTINQYHNGQGVPSGSPVYYNRPSSPHSEATLFVANMDSAQYGTDEKVRVDSERGPRVDIIAAGDDISSATSQVSSYSGKQFYPGSSTHYMAKIGGTSMAAPQITGMGALWLQANPGGTATDFKKFLKNNSTATAYDSGTAESFSYGNSYPRLYGAPNRVAHWPYNNPNPLRFRGTNGNDQ
jgi:hypothetical protein